jgi:hypothetical protein
MGKICLNASQIKDIISFLSKELPQKPTVDENLYCFPSKIKDRYANSDRKELIVQELADHIGFYLGIIDAVKVRFVEDTRGDFDFQVDQKGNVQGAIVHSFAGLYSANFVGKKQITIANEQIYRFPNLAAIVAHEFTHHYLHLHKIHCDIVNDEILTDLAAIYLGFGFLLLRGYETFGLSIGYVDDETIKKTIFISSRYRKWKKNKVRKQFESYWDKLRLHFF